MDSACKPYPRCNTPGHYGEEVHVPSPSLPLVLPSIASIDPDLGVSAPFIADPDSPIQVSVQPSIASIDT